MKKIIAAVIIAAASAALAQEPPAIPQTFALTVDQRQLGQIAEALLSLPKKDADPLIAALNKQIADQQTAFIKAEADRKKAEADKAKAVKK